MLKSEYDDFIKKITEARNIYIYGFGIIAYGIYKSLSEVHNIYPKYFVVTDTQGRDKEIERIKLINVYIASKVIQTEDIVLIATPEVYHTEIICEMNKFAINNYICIESDLEYRIMADYFRAYTDFTLLEDLLNKKLEISNFDIDMGVYMAKCHLDLPLRKYYEIPKWILPIQAGASLTNVRITNMLDNEGVNISEKNRNYSELTVTYWVWKNTKHKYKGICHYRRMLSLSEKELNYLESENIDAILPLPFVCYHDASDQFGRYISQEDFEIAMKVLEEIYPVYYNAARQIYSQKYIYNYNMLIAKGEIFDQYCEWLFSILEKIEQKWQLIGVTRQDRYIGYIGEILTSLYFMHNKNTLKIVHAKKKWLI